MLSQIEEKLSTKHLVEKCKICFKLVSSKSSLTRHIRMVHKDFENHEKKVSKEAEGSKIEGTVKGSLVKDLFQRCKLCFKSIKSSAFDLHLRRNHSGRSEKCKLCYLRFKRKDRLKKHLETIHVSEKHLLESEIDRTKCIFNCELCPLKFITNNVLSYHIERKHGRGNEQCLHCERRYPNSRKLKDHIGRVHNKT